MSLVDVNGNPLGKYMKHGLQHSLHQVYGGSRKKVESLPVCPRCERVGFRDVGWTEDKTMKCPHCGFRGKATHVLSAYIKEGLYK